jgi:nucleoside-diphosphate-sugar epimerase
MSGKTLVIGYGPVGAATVDRLRSSGGEAAVAQRSRPAALPSGVEFIRCDVLDGESTRVAVRGFDQLVVAIGFAYDGRVWQRDWPRAMQNLLAACWDTGARMVFVDNLYMYGPQTEPLRETMPLSSHGRKPAARSEVTRLWKGAAKSGAVRVAALRVPDFYGPGVGLSHIGDVGFAAIAAGRTARLIVPADTPHDFAYVPDVASAVETLLEAPDDAFGQAWHMPCAPTLTARQILALGAEAEGLAAGVQSLPLPLLSVLGLARGFLRETNEMRFQWDRPYRVDASKWRARFWSDVTPFEVGAPATMASFMAASARESMTRRQSGGTSAVTSAAA